jgi:hypothetical protein
MGRTKGTEKTGGREKGTPNRVTKRVRQWIFDVVQDNLDMFESDIKTLEPKERINVICGLLPYIVSKRNEQSNKMYTFDFTPDELENLPMWELPQF